MVLYLFVSLQFFTYSSLFKHLRSAQANWSGGQIGVSVDNKGLGVDASSLE